MLGREIQAAWRRNCLTEEPLAQRMVLTMALYLLGIILFVLGTLVVMTLPNPVPGA